MLEQQELTGGGIGLGVCESYGFAIAVPTFAIFFGAFAANILLAAMRAAPYAQLETAAAYGMTTRQTFRRTLVPQMWIDALCQQFTLIGSGMIWNVCFGLMALLLGFFVATALTLVRASINPLLRKPSEWFIFVFRGAPFFIQFFFGYFLFL